ncbi:MAG: hypothetical protein AB1595_00805 [bacterium]
MSLERLKMHREVWERKPNIGDISSFFKEIIRVLKIGGRILILDPYISPFSYFIYKFFHREGFDMKANIFEKKELSKDPFDSNMAIANLLFFKHKEIFRKNYPNLKIVKKELLSFILYPLSGGFEHPCFIPKSIIGIIKALEKILYPFRKLLALRTFVVIEKI